MFVFLAYSIHGLLLLLICLFFLQAGEEGRLELPGSEVKLGVLPKIIASLVERRKQVKSYMKDRSATATQLAQVSLKNVFVQ